MSQRMDLYIEKILSRMVVDDAQRVEIEREIRAHVADSIAEAQRQGLTLEQAEDEAILAFGQPSFLARAFQPTGGLAWFVFERSAAAIGAAAFLWVFLLGQPGFDAEMTGAGIPPGLTWLPKIVFLALMSLPFLARSFKRVEVNGGILVRRFLRPALKIPFDAVRKVRFQKGHVLGRRILVLEYEGGKLLLAPGLPGLRAAAVALGLFASDKVEEGAQAGLAQIGTRFRRERLPLKIGLSLGWCLAIASWAICFGPLWTTQGLPWLFLFAGLAGPSLLVLQRLWLVDRAKVGLSNLLLGAAVVAPVGVVGSLIGGRPDWGRWMILVYSAVLCLSLPVIWWRWRRGHLLGLAGLLGAAVVASWWLAPLSSHFPARALWVSNGIPTSVQWLPGGDGAAWINHPGKDGRAFLNVARFGKAPSAILLPAKASDVKFLPSRTADHLYLYSDPVFDAPDNFTHGVYSVELAKNAIERIPNQPETFFVPWIWYFAGKEMWSPDERYLIGAEYRDKTQWMKSLDMAILDTSTGHTTLLPDVDRPHVVQWLDDHRFEAVWRATANTQEEEDRDAPHDYEIWEVDAATGQRTLERTYRVRPGEFLEFLDSPRYALLAKSKKGAGPDKHNAGTEFFDLSDGSRIPLPSETNPQCFDWNREKEVLLCQSGPGDQTKGQTLYIVSPVKGVLAQHTFPSEMCVQGMKLATDTRRVLCFLKRDGGPFIFSCEWRVWDVGKGTDDVVDSQALIPRILSAIAIPSAPVESSLPLWAPDGKSYLVPSMYYSTGSGSVETVWTVLRIRTE